MKMEIWYPVILFMLATTCGEANGNMTRNLPVSDAEHNVTKRDLTAYVLGGSPESMPTAVAIFIMLDDNPIPQPRCSGTILSEDIVLSAAHCFFDENGTDYNFDAFIILAGEGDLRHYLVGDPNLVQELNVTDVIIHPYYKYVNDVPGEQDELIWDLAILKLSTKIKIETNSRVQAALLPPPGLIHVGKEIKVGGWGKYTVEYLASVVHRAIDIKINPDWKCYDSFGYGEFISSQMFCAGKKGRTTCSGDSGAGGLIYVGLNKPIIVGVLSFGVSDCAKASAFQRVEKSLPWIYKETKLRPAYEVFEDETIYEDFLQDTKTTTTPIGCGPEAMSVVSGDVYFSKTLFTVDKIFTNNNGEPGYIHGRFWLGIEQKASTFVLNLGCQLRFEGIQLVNTHNAGWRDRSTKRFRLSVSQCQTGPWQNVLETTLEDSRRQTDPLPLQLIDLKEEVTGQFLKFELLEWYGRSGGLQYFDIQREN